MAFKIVISDPKTRKAYQKEVDNKASGLNGKKLGEKVSGDFLGLSGYEIQLTGGSDKDGFPMRPDIEGVNRKRALVTRGIGFKSKVKGIRKRRSLRGNTISDAISQINVKVIKHGSKTVEELLGLKPKEKEEEKDLSDEEKRLKRAEEAQKLNEQMTDDPKLMDKPR